MNVKRSISCEVSFEEMILIGLSEGLFDQGVDPTSLFRRGEGEETAVRCNFHRLQMIVFNSN
jgi:hypothetical protein